jgi:hypothetical protein
MASPSDRTKFNEQKNPVPHERRKHNRLNRHFSAKLSRVGTVGLYFPVGGMTDNVGQGGAFIKTKHWDDFQPHDLIVITLRIPPSFSGQEKTISLTGPAVVARIVEENEGVAVQFTKPFQQFESLTI